MPLDGISIQNPLEETFGIDPIQEGLNQDAIDNKPVNPGYEETTSEEDFVEEIPPNPPLKGGDRIPTDNFLDEQSLNSLEYLNDSEIENNSESNDATKNDPITGEVLDDDGNLIADELPEDMLINPGSDAELDESRDETLSRELQTSDELDEDLETEVSETETTPVPPFQRGVRGDNTDNSEANISLTSDISEESNLGNVNFDRPLEPIFESGTFTVDDTGEVSIDYVFDGGGYKGQLAIFSLDGLEAFELGSVEFIQEVTRRALSGSESGHIVISDRTDGAKFTGNLGERSQNSGTYQGVQTFAMRPGDTFGVMLIPNGTVQEVFDDPEIGGAKRPLFSLATANPNDGFHIGQIADVTGDRNTFVLEDLRVDRGSDRDYNDMIFQVRGAVGDAVLLDDVIKEDKDWRTSDLGEAIVAYAKPYVIDDGLATDEVRSERFSVSTDDGLATDEVRSERKSVQTDDGLATDEFRSERKSVQTDDGLATDEFRSERKSVQTDDLEAIAPETNPESDPEDERLKPLLPTIADIDNSDSEETDLEAIADIDNSDSEETETSDERLKPLLPTIADIENSDSEETDLEAIADIENSDSEETDLEAIADIDNSDSEETETSDERLKPLLPTDRSESDPEDERLKPLLPTDRPQTDAEDERLKPLLPTDRPQTDAEDERLKPLLPTIAQQIEQAVESGDRILTLPDTDSELGDRDRTALEYARQNQLILVVDAGKEADKISPLGRASLEFDNIITVGTANGEASAENSGTGRGLNVLATENVSEVSDAVDQVLEANSQLSPSQVVEVLKLTATDVQTPNWDEQTGSGLLNTEAAVHYAKTIKPESVGVGANGHSPLQESDELSAHLDPAAPKVVEPIANLTLTPQENSATVDLSSVFSAANDEPLTYEIISSNSAALAVNLEENKLQLNAGNVTGNTPVTVRATDPAGNMATHTFAVTTNTWNSETIQAVDTALADVAAAINPDDMIGSLESESAETAFVKVEKLLADNPEIVKFLGEPESLKNLGVSEETVETVEMLLNSPEVGAAMGLPVPLSEVFNEEGNKAPLSKGGWGDSPIWESSLINAAEAFSLLPDDAPQPQVGIIDFAGQHGEQVTDIFESVNPIADPKLYNIDNANWAEQLVKFVDKVKASGESQGIVNLSFDLTQVDADGRITTRYELTPQEQLALQYARDNNVLIVAASGNTGDMMSALGEAADEFDNIITVGAVNNESERADYSSKGDTLTLVAPGGEFSNDPDAFVGTSKATAYVTGAASLIWAANPELNYQQVKQILTSTAVDLGPEGWDEDTGAGLIDVTEAVFMAGLLAPEGLVGSEGFSLPEPFTGEGRVTPIERATSPNTDRAISDLQTTQDKLLEQWQVLADLGNPNLTLEELAETVQEKQADGLETYRQADTEAATLQAEAQQLSEALAMATQHYQIETERLQKLQAQEQELTDRLSQLQQEKADLDQSSPQQLQAIEDAIAQTKKDIIAAQEKLQYQLVDPETLLSDSDAVRQEAAKQLELAEDYRQNALAYAAQRDNYQSDVNNYRQQQAHHQNIANQQGRGHLVRRGRCGFKQWYNPVKEHHQNQANIAGKNALTAQNQANIAEQNRISSEQLAPQFEQQATALNNYANLLDSQQSAIANSQGTSEDAEKLLASVTEQANQQQALADSYWQQAAAAEQRRKQNQDTANHYQGRYRRWEVVGHRRKKKRSGRGRLIPIHGWRHYPEYIAPRDYAQQQANQAEQERRVVEQLARQAQQEADALKAQGEKLEQRIEDWPSLKQGIEYEVQANELQLQGEEDLLALQTQVGTQHAVSLQLQIEQAETELQELEAEQLPTQEQVAAETENRLTQLQSQLDSVRQSLATAQQNRQTFLETSGYLLPFQERKAAIQQQIADLESEQIRVQELILQLAGELAQNPNAVLQEQLTQLQQYGETLQEELDWAKVWQEQLNLSSPDSPQRLAISALIKELEERAADEPATNTLPLQESIDFLRDLENTHGDLTAGFDNLGDRLETAQQEQTQTEETLPRLQEEYRNLGLEKAEAEADLEPQIAQQQQLVDAKDEEIAAIEEDIEEIQNLLTPLEDELAAKEEELANNSTQVAPLQPIVTPPAISPTNQNDSIYISESNNTSLVITGLNNDPIYIGGSNRGSMVITGSNNHVISIGESNMGSMVITGSNNQPISIGESNMGSMVITGSNNQPISIGESNRGSIAITGLNNDYISIDGSNNGSIAIGSDNTGPIVIGGNNSGAITINGNNTNSIVIKGDNTKTITIKGDNDADIFIEGTNYGSIVIKGVNTGSIKTIDEKLKEEINQLKSQIEDYEHQLDELNNNKQTSNEERDELAAGLANLKEQLQEFEDKLSDKYREIELTEDYLTQVSVEVDRLQSRLDLINEADQLEQVYQAQQTAWNTALENQIVATDSLLETRAQTESDRAQILALESALAETETALAEKQAQQAQTQAEIEDSQQALDLSQLQLKNQELLLQKLLSDDAPLQSGEANYYNRAQQHRQRIWYWNGRQYAYNANEAAAYRANLQEASLLADQRNKVWQQVKETEEKIAELQPIVTGHESDIAAKQSELAAIETGVGFPPFQGGLGGINPLSQKKAELEAQIAPIQARLEPFQQQEKQQTEAFQTAANTAQTVASDLSETTQEQLTALHRLINFGVLASESDLDFLPNQVQPKVNQFIDQLKQRTEDLATQAEQLNQLIAGWQQELDNTVDETSAIALTQLIETTTAQRDALLGWQKDNEAATTELQEALERAMAALTPLRQQQELDIRQQLDSNQQRLTALGSQLAAEQAAENAIASDTVLAYAELGDRVELDLRNAASDWAQQLQEGHQQTKELGETQQELSQDVDDLIANIEDNFADPNGDYQSSLADLRDDLTTLGVVAPRYDELQDIVKTLEQDLEQFQLTVKQDEELWSEIKPIVERYDAEADAVEEYQERSQVLNDIKTVQDNNLIRNGSFEDTEGVTGITRGQGALPEGWINISPYWNGADTYSEDGSFGLQGSAYGNFSGAKAQDGSQWVAGGSAYYERVAQKLETPLEPGQTYELSAYLKRATHSINSNPGGYEVFLADSTGLNSKIPLGTFEPTDNPNEWERRSFSFVAPEAAKTHPYIVFRPISGVAGASYPALDNISLAAAIHEEAQEKAIPHAKALLEKVTDNPQYKEEAESLRQHLAEYDRLMGQDDKDQAAQHLTSIVDNARTLLRPTFIDNNPENGTAIETLQQETAYQRDAYQQQLNQAQAETQQNSAQSSAALAQADWYETQATKHWELSRKNGPYWYEWRKTYTRNWYGKKKTKWVRVVHIDHHWILWNTYTQYAKQLRAQGVDQLIASQQGDKQQERLTPLVNQWTEANNAANEAAPSILATRNLLEVLEAAREQIPQTKEQIELLGELLPEELQQDLANGDVEIETLTGNELLDLLPDLRADLELASREAETSQEKVNDDWDNYDNAAAAYKNALTAVLEQRGRTNSSAQTLQQELADSEAWVERQSVALGTELSQVQALRQQLQQQTQQFDPSNQSTGLDDQTKLAQLQRSLDLLDNKEAVLAAQQTALSQKRTLLAAQNEVIVAEQRLLDAYLESPDADLDTLQQQLQDARAALAEAQRLAEQAEASSQALTAPLQELAVNLLAQNDQHLQAAKEHQAILKDLLEATELHANYTLEAAQKQQQVNDLEFQLLQRLQQATEAGSQEAKHLLDVATHNDMATAAELYYRDYSDLASDKGGGCSGGIARPEDRILANRYYGQMLQHRQLQHRAQAQANHFAQIRQAAETAKEALQAQQTEARERLNELSKEIATTEEEKTRKEQELAVAEARLEGISRIRQQTEQTFVQLVTLEKLNLAQAQLEQQIASQRQQDIETAVQQRLDREQLELERQRLAARAKLEQLYQLQAETDLQEALNEVRNDLGLENLQDVEEPAQLQSQMAALLGQLQQLQSQQPDLPEDVKALLADARGDLHLALQGKEAETIQENLLKATEGLVGQVQHYQAEIGRLELEQQWDNQLLAVAENDLQAASREFIEELQKAELLQGERSTIEPLYIETLTKVAYAEQAVEISQELAQQSKEIFEEILEQRKIEREARKKAFWNELLSVVSTVISIISTVLMLIPASAPFAALASQIGLGLALVAGGISATQAAINGDWLGAVFSAVMAAASFVGGSFGSALKLAKEGATKVAVFGAQVATKTAQRVQATISSLSALASGAFNGVRSALSGDSILGFLQVLGGVAGATVSSLGSTLAATSTGQLGYKVLQSMTNAPAAIYSSIKAIENGDLVSGIGTIVKTVASLAKIWANDFQEGQSGLEKFADILENIGYSAVGVANFVTGGFEGLLDGIGDIIDGLGDNISQILEEHFNGCKCISEDYLEKEAEEISNLILDELGDLAHAGRPTSSAKNQVLKVLSSLSPELRAKVLSKLGKQYAAAIARIRWFDEQLNVFEQLPLDIKKVVAKELRWMHKYGLFDLSIYVADASGSDQISSTIAKLLEDKNQLEKMIVEYDIYSQLDNLKNDIAQSSSPTPIEQPQAIREYQDLLFKLDESSSERDEYVNWLLQAFNYQLTYNTSAKLTFEEFKHYDKLNSLLPDIDKKAWEEKFKPYFPDISAKKATTQGIVNTKINPSFALDIYKAIEKGEVRPEVGIFLISLVATESYGGKWNAKNGLGYLGAFQMGQAERKKFAPNISDSDFLNHPEVQLKAAQGLYDEKLKILQSLEKQKEWKNYFSGKSEVYKVAHAWIKLEMNGIDGNGVSVKNYANAAETSSTMLKQIFGLETFDTKDVTEN